jgi:putative oxidoreductase
MERWLGRYSEVLYAVMRAVIGFLFACHGAQKLLGMFGGQGWPSEPMMLVAGIIELGGGILVALGLWAGFAAFLASGQMAFAYFMAHAKGGFWPILNRGELAVAYCFIFLYIASKGSGRFSVEGLIGRRRF